MAKERGTEMKGFEIEDAIVMPTRVWGVNSIAVVLYYSRRYYAKYI
ncbi:MAG: hypothetical protein AAB443_01735 [Patescibacteria group bacterium]